MDAVLNAHLVKEHAVHRAALTAVAPPVETAEDAEPVARRTAALHVPALAMGNARAVLVHAWKIALALAQENAPPPAQMTAQADAYTNVPARVKITAMAALLHVKITAPTDAVENAMAALLHVKITAPTDAVENAMDVMGAVTNAPVVASNPVLDARVAAPAEIPVDQGVRHHAAEPVAIPVLMDAVHHAEPAALPVPRTARMTAAPDAPELVTDRHRHQYIKNERRRILL